MSNIFMAIREGLGTDHARADTTTALRALLLELAEREDVAQVEAEREAVTAERMAAASAAKARRPWPAVTAERVEPEPGDWCLYRTSGANERLVIIGVNLSIPTAWKLLEVRRPAGCWKLEELGSAELWRRQ